MAEPNPEAGDAAVPAIFTKKGTIALKDYSVGKRLFRSRSETSCDTVIVVDKDNTRIPAHRVVLRLVSGPFKEIFKRSTDIRFQEMTIKHFGGTTVKKAIEFCYMGKVKITGKDVFELMAFADVFELRQLKNKCAAFLRRNIDKDNCVPVWSVAQLCKAKALEKFAADYILANDEVVNGFEAGGINRLELFFALKFMGEDLNRSFYGFPAKPDESNEAEEGENGDADQPPCNIS